MLRLSVPGAWRRSVGVASLIILLAQHELPVVLQRVLRNHQRRIMRHRLTQSAGGCQSQAV